MFDGDDAGTFYAIRTLHDCISESTKPLVLWIGAGTSAWCGYPLWDELADHMHSQFLKYEKQYDKQLAIGLINTRDNPALFNHCHSVNSKLYHSILANTFRPPCAGFSRGCPGYHGQTTSSARKRLHSGIAR